MDYEVVIEIPKGSRNKYEADHETAEILARPTALHGHAVPDRLRLLPADPRRRR